MEYLRIAELMREAGECFLLPRVYDEENINLTDRCIAWERATKEDASVTTGPTPRPKVTRRKEKTAHDPAPPTSPRETTKPAGTPGPAQIAIEAARREAAPAVDNPRREEQLSPAKGGFPGRGDNIDFNDLYNTKTQQHSTIDTDIPPTIDLVHELAEQFHEAFRYVPGRKEGIQSALRDLLQRDCDYETIQAALAYVRWWVKRPGSPLENPVGWFKTCVTRQFWETDPRYRTYQNCRRRRQNNDRPSPAFDPDGEDRLSAKEFQ